MCCELTIMCRLNFFVIEWWKYCYFLLKYFVTDEICFNIVHSFYTLYIRCHFEMLLIIYEDQII